MATPAEIAEVAGWWSEMLALAGSLCLVVPLFYLLATRDALEDLEDDSGLDRRTAGLFRTVRGALQGHVRNGRSYVRLLTILGTVLLVLALLAAILQGLRLPERLFGAF
jgi:hypothetical protein